MFFSFASMFTVFSLCKVPSKKSPQNNYTIFIIMLFFDSTLFLPTMLTHTLSPYYHQRTIDCPDPVNVLAVVLGVIGGILLLGLILLLIWKLVVFILDRREYAQFEQERQNARWDTVRFYIFFSMFFSIQRVSES